MIGVVHATRTIDAIQRFIGRIELGMIPQIVDTVVHIDGGQVQEIFTLTFTVKVPSGMTESDLARPVIEVFSFEDRRLQNEKYTFGEEVVVMAVGGGRGSRQHPSRTAQRNGEAEGRALMPDAEVQIEVRNNRVVIRAQPEDMPYLIGKKGKSVARLEARLGMKVDVVEAQGPEWKEELPVYVKAQKKYYVLSVDKHYAGRSLAFFSEGRELFQGTTNKKGSIKIENESDMGTELSYLVQKKKFIYAVPV
jgi:ATPase